MFSHSVRALLAQPSVVELALSEIRLRKSQLLTSVKDPLGSLDNNPFFLDLTVALQELFKFKMVPVPGPEPVSNMMAMAIWRGSVLDDWESVMFAEILRVPSFPPMSGSFNESS